MTSGFGFKWVEMTAYEIDKNLSSYLMHHIGKDSYLKLRTIISDYIELVIFNGL